MKKFLMIALFVIGAASIHADEAVRRGEAERHAISAFGHCIDT